MEAIATLLAQIGLGIYNLATAKTVADQAAAIAQMKAAILDGEAKVGTLLAELAATDKVIDAKVDEKFKSRHDEPTVDLKHGAVVVAVGPAEPLPIDDLK